MEKRSLFRALHDEEGCFIIPNPWDTGTACILQALGFRALATTSAGMAFSLGLREGQASRDQVLAHCKQIVSATGLPVSADLEHGFGHSPESAAETIRAAAAVGLAGGSLEDHTGDPDDPIYELDLAVERIAAAAQARDELREDFVLTARCENFLWDRPDLDDTIRRLQAYQEAGADVLYAPGLRDLATIGNVCSSLSKPVNVLMGMPDATHSVEDLARAGVKRISVGSALARLAFGAFARAAQDMQATGRFAFTDEAMGFVELEEFFPPLT
ncbi:isocitrate lyase/PEP mutase family protein [Sedimentitalea nanhaiensis]|uniref:2-Methylisocitrate lyase, PEP mutase family n=1 Tax=Sedimentitalea nanhaiensis TaxID=999627 RepID=A0A1I7BQ22_9RHOB|nr:isocitrate lyase/phosphoenolpyruvate mutase family protein [Sedimentitalea nanhaiensis]SFT89287.1 2-Methylisocitrate lyase, PEP mutase family [Sedimentitalea nanhaiensis]